MNCIATIVSANYLAYARVLGESVVKHQPNTVFKVLVVDRATEEIREAVGAALLDVTFAQDLDLPNFEALAFKYELVEFNTALKPTFLKRLFAAGFEKVIYLDPDICLFDSLEPVINALEADEIVLTPHSLAPAMDGLRPSDIDFLRNGSFNLGFIGLRRGHDCAAFLDWWESRCLSYGFNDLGFGTFVDQKWIDLVPAYFASVHILRHQGCNVAYWNLHERSVTIESGKYAVGNNPLSFFHFSGVKADKPKILSRHQTRHSIKPDTPLASLVVLYCNALIRMDHNNFSGIKYTFGNFDNGVSITRTMRRSICFQHTERNPFSAAGPLYKKYQEMGLLKGQAVDGASSVNTLNFDQDSKQVVIVNKIVRLLTRIIGVDRFLSLMRYAAFLTRESNFARVLHSVRFDFSQEESRR